MLETLKLLANILFILIFPISMLLLFSYLFYVNIEFRSFRISNYCTYIKKTFPIPCATVQSF